MRRRHTFLLGAIAILITAPTSSAHAQIGSYEVVACNYAEGINNSWVWATSDQSHPPHYAEHVNCPDRLGGNGGRIDQEGGLSTTDELGLSNGAPPGTSAGWTFTAPTGTTITGITYERYIGHMIDPDNDWSPALRADGVIIPGETCLDSVENGESCFVGGPPGEGGEPSVVTGLSAHQLALSIICQAPSEDECVTGATEHKAWAAMYGSKVTINDPTPPTLGTPTGTLWEQDENEFHKGTQSVTVSADDAGGGVQNIELIADGHPIETYTAPCNFTYPKPCPNETGPQTLTLPTTQLSDGTHTITVTVNDAAGNQTTTSQQIIVVNNPPPPPTELKATAIQPGSTTFVATWTDPSGQIAPITSAAYEVCPADGLGACSVPTAAAGDGPAMVTVPAPGTWVLAVWLTNAAGVSNAARTTLVVASTSGTSDTTLGAVSSGGGPPGDSDSSTPSGSHAPRKTTIHVTEALHGRELVVRVSGPATGRVRVSYAGRYRGRTIAFAAKIVTLAGGHVTVTFKLTVLAAGHARIRVNVISHEAGATSTLLRRHK